MHPDFLLEFLTFSDCKIQSQGLFHFYFQTILIGHSGSYRGVFRRMILFCRHYLLAMTSISTIAPLGRSFTAKQTRAGLLVGK